MKILKPGKVEQRKFICKCCGCEFAGNINDTYLWQKTETEGSIFSAYGSPCRVVLCPCCVGKLLWHEGEPYEEPELLTQSDVERLAELLQHDDGSWSSMDFADFLLSHGVTFKEE